MTSTSIDLFSHEFTLSLLGECTMLQNQCDRLERENSKLRRLLDKLKPGWKLADDNDVDIESTPLMIFLITALRYPH